jgi:hypothetical protein
MMTRRQVICHLGSVSFAAWFVAALIGLIFSVAPKAKASVPKVPFESAAPSISATRGFLASLTRKTMPSIFHERREAMN